MGNRKPTVTRPPKPRRLKATDFERAYDGTVVPSKSQIREEGRRYIARLRAQFVVTRNPLFAWKAYAEARAVGVSIPDWVHDYLDDAWRNLGSLDWHPPQKQHVARAIAEAVGFTRGAVTLASWKRTFHPADLARSAKPLAGRVNPFLRKKDGRYNPFGGKDAFTLAFAVYDALCDKHQLLYAYEEAATRQGVSRRTVERAWADYRSQFPLNPSDKK